MLGNLRQAGTNPAFFGSMRGGGEPANYRKHPHGEGGTLARPTRGGWGERGSTPAHQGGSARQLRPPAPKGGGGAVLAGAGWGFPPTGGTGGGKTKGWEAPANCALPPLKAVGARCLRARVGASPL